MAGISRRRETALFHRLCASSPLQYIARFPERLVPQKIVVSCFARNAGHAVRPANNFLRACEARPACAAPQKYAKKTFSTNWGFPGIPGSLFFMRWMFISLPLWQRPRVPLGWDQVSLGWTRTLAGPGPAVRRGRVSRSKRVRPFVKRTVFGTLTGRLESLYCL